MSAKTQKAKNLWGKLSDVKIEKTPYAILLEQSSALQDLTDGLLIGKIRRTQADVEFILEFFITAPSLDNYAYQLLAVKHGIDLYPVTIFETVPGSLDDADLYSNKFVSRRSMLKGEYECHSKDEFDKALGKILSSERVQKVIRSLLALIKVENGISV